MRTRMFRLHRKNDFGHTKAHGLWSEKANQIRRTTREAFGSLGGGWISPPAMIAVSAITREKSIASEMYGVASAVCGANVRCTAVTIAASGFTAPVQHLCSCML